MSCAGSSNKSLYWFVDIHVFGCACVTMKVQTGIEQDTSREGVEKRKKLLSPYTLPLSSPVSPVSIHQVL